MQSFVLSEYMKAHPEYLERMVAAYVVGYSITEDFLKANPHLKFAEGADDTGVIISYNTEGQETGTILLFCQVPSASIPSTGNAMRPMLQQRKAWAAASSTWKPRILRKCLTLQMQRST